MKYKLNTVGGIKSAENTQELHVFLEGDDNSQHNFVIKVEGRDINSLTLNDIHALALEHARNSFANCD